MRKLAWPSQVTGTSGIHPPWSRKRGEGNEGTLLRASKPDAMQRSSAASAMAVELTAGLLFATALSDALGFASISFLLLLVGVPACATAGLVCLARRVEADHDPLGTLQSVLAGI